MPLGMWVMRTADFGLVDVLPARARGAISVDAAVAFVDVDLDAVVDDRIDPDGSEARVAARVRVVGRDADEPVHARFRLQPAVGVVSLDDDGRRLDAGFVACRFFDDFDLEFAPLRPAHVHAQEHPRPIAAFRAAGAGMDFEVGVVGVRLARQQRLELAPLTLGFQRLQRRDALGLGRFVPLGFAEFDQRRRVLELALDLGERPQPVLERGALAHQLLGGLGVVPEGGVLGFRIEFGQTPRRCVDVKDASSAVRRTA